MSGPRAVVPSLETVRSILTSPATTNAAKKPTLVPVYRQISSDLITPSAAYLKVSAHHKDSDFSFLFESAATEQVGRYSFVGAGPRKVLATGPGHGPECDPLPALEAELAQHVVAHVPGLQLPPMAGGAVGYVGYDCVRYFEPKTARPMKDVLQIPESLFMLFDTIVAFDRFYGVIKVITYLHVPEDAAQLEAEYQKAMQTIDELVAVLNSPDIPIPEQQPIKLGQEYTSNVGQQGYESHVTELKKHIVKGDIIQAVPSQRFARPTTLHPFNIYRHLRTVNPSPYLFYVNCKDFQIVGASPELLVKSEAGRVITHPIAGTVKRGKTPEEDQRLADELRSSLKDRAEHVMLVDLARNDVNRVGDPYTVRVDHLMVVEKFSHVQHLVSQVSGVLRAGQTRFDAFRSIFPAGTVSGAPKVRAMELIAELEKEKRGIYAGAVGYFGYGGVDEKGEEVEGAMDTCIALRTMLVKDGVAYLQAGGGIVFDSDEYDEWLETMNKLGANMQCITTAEELYYDQQQQAAGKS
ncbi:anthranilate synthase component I [Colletotrichum scovillei]|uniref:anthranilate synthase n=1 Tax=Colletotrichum scovillei TaxID=1209932 RepID=A0A9P7UFL8_9PEZI|nr:anthranilate synthase component I [Colletotrichum scovillei]KAF4777073.1 anthranilate synthase component I [Colletotrichum scovillei]KAG7054011.1 anthranilate synthase component 1 [Colletotrichum scovillei]KAG7072270.1 anthranilate synthase component 1 [Colletotrichum scovillei]KAG7080513.1 anthranilate synthase component 1 [Colletotrichum scovillei]